MVFAMLHYNIEKRDRPKERENTCVQRCFSRLRGNSKRHPYFERCLSVLEKTASPPMRMLLAWIKQR